MIDKAPHPEAEVLSVGVLDIFGFENFEFLNSFEQLCINVANEQLQFYFNQHIFATAIKEMEQEGIGIRGIEFLNNQKILDMFLQRPLGIYAILDEETFFPLSTDITFSEKLHKNMKSNKTYYIAPKFADTLTFSIVHFAGTVVYHTKGFLEKNRDALSGIIKNLLMLSGTNSVVVELYTVPITVTGAFDFPAANISTTITTTTTTGGVNASLVKKKTNPTKNGIFNFVRGTSKKVQYEDTPHYLKNAHAQNQKEVKPGTKKQAPTLSSFFKNSLTQLMFKMNNATPSFVRCLKPNHNLRPAEFIATVMGQQLKYNGVLETVTIRRDGYSLR